MKRIQKGPVRGISLRLQEEVRALFLINKPSRCFFSRSIIDLFLIGKRTQVGLHPREIRNSNRRHRGPQGCRPQVFDQGPWHQTPHPRSRQEGGWRSR